MILLSSDFTIPYRIFCAFSNILLCVNLKYSASVFCRISFIIFFKLIGKNAFGYQGNIFDEEDYEYGEENSIQDFKITGYSNTAAETYAKENGFEFISLGEQILTGDANQDGTVNIKDVTYLQMHIAGNKNTDGSPLIDETNKQLFDSIDMNNDGKLTVNDVTALQTYLTQNN